MLTRLTLALSASTGVWFAVSAHAGEGPPIAYPLSMGTGIGMALVILLAVLIGLSVVAKLLIVFGVVPRRAESGFHALVHGAANFVGGLTRTKPRRRSRFDDR